MIEWIERADPTRPFLISDDRLWTYAQLLAEVEERLSSRPRVVVPSLAHDSIFDLVAAVAGGGATVASPRNEVLEPADSTLVVYTSGTSGPPKGVRLTRANLSAAAEASAGHLGLTEGDVWLLAMPLHHVAGISILIRQMWVGGAVRLLPGFTPASFASALQEVTLASAVPTMLHRIVDKGPFQGLRAVLVGGGPIPAALLERSAAVGIPVLPSYGMTETFGQVATLTPGALRHRRRIRFRAWTCVSRTTAASPCAGARCHLDMWVSPTGRMHGS